MLSQSSRKVGCRRGCQGSGRNASREEGQHQWQCEFSVETCPTEPVPSKRKTSSPVESTFCVNSRVLRLLAIDFAVYIFNCIIDCCSTLL